MGWNFRKSINLGGGMRLNFSKSGIGISGGMKGFRIGTGPRGTRFTGSIPGTGVYYTKNLSGGKKRTVNTKKQAASNAATRQTSTYQFSQVVTNDVTGETRELRARTQFELNQLVELETERQRINELRMQQLQAARDKQDQVDAMNQQLIYVKDNLQKIITQTLLVDDRIDWDREMIKTEYPPLRFTEKAPSYKNTYKLNFFKSLFMNEKKFELPYVETAEYRAFEKRRNEIIQEYLEKKAAFDIEKNKQNGEMAYLRKRFEQTDKDAVERYISIVLTKSKYPPDFEHDFEVKYNKEKKKVIVNYLFQDIDSFPVVDRYVYNRDKDEIEEVLMPKDKAMTFYSEVLYSVGVRTMHEIFESVYTDSVDEVCFNGYIEDMENQCAFAMRSPRKKFETIDLRQPLEKIIGVLETRTIGDFTKNDQITPFE